MTPLQSLHLRGFTVQLRHPDRLQIYPPPNGLAEQIRRHKSEIVAELNAHRQTMEAQAVELESQILQLLDDNRITQTDAEEKLTYVFRLTATTPCPQGPCPDCGEVLLWCLPAEVPANLHKLCYRCNPPADGGMAYFLAAESEPESRPRESLEHSSRWL